MSLLRVQTQICVRLATVHKSVSLGNDMQDLKELNLLIDRAKAIAGSDGKVAAAIGIQRQVLSDWRHGRKNPQAEDYALLASVANLDPVIEMARAAVRIHEGKPKGDALMKALGKALLVTGGALGSAGASAAAIFSSIPAPTGRLFDLIVAGVTMYRRSNRPIQEKLCQAPAA